MLIKKCQSCGRVFSDVEIIEHNLVPPVSLCSSGSTAVPGSVSEIAAAAKAIRKRCCEKAGTGLR